MQKQWLVRIGLLMIFFIALLKPIFDQEHYQKPAEKDKSTVIDLQKKQPEQPLHDVNLPSFAEITDVREKKKQFFAFIRPAIETENSRISAIRARLLAIQSKLQLTQPLTANETRLMRQLTQKYKINKKFAPAKKIQELLNRVDIVPKELVLVQAANESAWGTSRFARIGLNFFGIWCYKKGCGMVPNGRDEGLKHEVAAFKSIERAVQHYLYNINTNAAYRVFRTIRAQLRQHNKPLSAQILATGLLPYSERGSDYVLEISEMIRHNKHYFHEQPSD